MSDQTTCRRCSECQGASHHWMADPRPEDDGDWEPGEYACKHCDVRGELCAACDGDGCPVCDGEGVRKLSDEEYDHAMYRSVEP